MSKKAKETAGVVASVLFLVGLVGISRADDAALSVNRQMPGLSEQQKFPATKLRGYGTISGQGWTDSAGGALLQIECQDAEHARLVQAKYLSDLEELPPGTKPAQIDDGGARISVRTAEDVGAVTALRSGTTVVLASAKSADALARLISGGVQGSATKWTSVAEGKVPMFLDRFDKYGFRFYYAPGRLKEGPDRHAIADYDVREDFNFAQAMHAGLLVWTGGQNGDTGEWLTKEPSWDFALKEAQARGLAFGLNLGIESGVTWFYNRDPESLMQFAPGFLGSYYGSMNFGIGPMVSWSSPAGQDALLGQLQTTVRKLKDVDNITSWLEPHEELGGGAADLFVDVGPAADVSFRDFLRGKYKTIEALSQRYADPALTSWNNVHAPEPADFLGWNADAIDLAGTWKINFDAAENPSALSAQFDDSAWGEMNGPGDGLARLLPAKPAVWRRHFTVDSAWLAKHPAVWLYVWDMNDVRAAKVNPALGVAISVNGKIAEETKPNYSSDHWTAIDVTQVVQPGDNLLAVRLPRGLFNYRVYLSGDEPKSYPQLGEGGNARWVDFSDWLSYSRVKGVRRGMQMIRQADPDRGIMLMAPDRYEDDLLEAALDYGGDFHNTGYMGGWWCDKLPALMRGAGLPFSTEPSQGPTKAAHVLGSFGNWITQGVNAIDHFQNLGEVLWNPEVKKCFEDHATLYTSVGRYHAVPAQVAALYSNRINNLLGFPWNERPATENGEPYFRGGSYPSAFNSRGFYSPMEYVPKGSIYESDAVTEKMFIANQADKYRVIVDTDTAVMDEATIDGIERYVRAGGVFVTYGETGRHSPEKPDSWPIERLTGFHVTDSKPGSGTVTLDAGQKIFPPGFLISGNCQGHKLNAAVADVQNVMNWNDGSVAAGIRPLGKGYVITLGAWFSQPNGEAFFASLFQWLKIDPIPAHVETAGKVFWRHFLSNNGLYDLWVVRNTDSQQPSTGTLVLADGLRPAWSVDLNTGTRTPVTDGKIPFNLPPGDMAISITPRTQVASSPADWFNLQRGWWQGTADPGAPLPKPDMKLAFDLTDGWAFQPVDAQQADVSDLVGVATDDGKWKQVSLGIFSLPDYPDCRHAVIRRHFHVPDAWKHGHVQLRLPQFRTWAQVYLDGQKLQEPVELPGGSDHVLAVEIKSTGYLLGAMGSGWLAYHPDPVSTQDLPGPWQSSPDLMTWTDGSSLPGDVAKGVRAFRSSFTVAPATAGQTIVLHLTQKSSEARGVIINGTYLLRAHDGGEINLNITPWVVPGKKNVIVIPMGGSHETITGLDLEFHPKGTYP